MENNIWIFIGGKGIDYFEIAVEAINRESAIAYFECDNPDKKWRITKQFSQKMYYVRNEGYLGNALIWWKKGCNGYTCDIRDAEKFTREQAESTCKRPQDTAYECDYIDNLLVAQKLIIDSQYVDKEHQLFK